MGQAEHQKQYTAAEYFALEAQSEVRHEFFEGEIFAMAGESIAHNTIALNVSFALRLALRGKGCRVLMEGVKLAVRENHHYTYPDVMVSCAPADLQETRMLRQPVLLVEVLSPSTAAYDRGGKFKRYKELASLRHYLLVSQATWRVEWYRRTEANEWVHTVLTEPEEELRILELNLQLTLAAVYEDAGVAPLHVELLPVAPPQAEEDLEQSED